MTNTGKVFKEIALHQGYRGIDYHTFGMIIKNKVSEEEIDKAMRFLLKEGYIKVTYHTIKLPGRKHCMPNATHYELTEKGKKVAPLYINQR